MKKLGAFTLSLDCEGLWGMADQPNIISCGLINQSSLRHTYSFIGKTLDQCHVKCTAAFVTAFAAGSEILKEHQQKINDLSKLAPRWFKNIQPIIESGNYDGWDGHEFFVQLSNSGHEMAWHGTTHLSLDDITPDAAVDLELELGRDLLSCLNCKPASVVFPRNRVGHLNRLKQAGFEIYRASRDNSNFLKITELFREWHVWDQRVSQKPCGAGGWGVIPPGDFLNWPSRIRAGIPIEITVKRWKSLLRSAVESGGYVHMWFHPHNLITAPAMKSCFEEIIQEVGQLVRSGDMLVLTMNEAFHHFADNDSGVGV